MANSVWFYPAKKPPQNAVMLSPRDRAVRENIDEANPGRTTKPNTMEHTKVIPSRSSASPSISSLCLCIQTIAYYELAFGPNAVCPSMEALPGG